MGTRRPWNMVDLPVYSLATYADDRVNMNICTYAMAVSMKPKMYIAGIYYGTRTLELLAASGKGILQILHQDHLSLIRPLGKKSGLNYDKEAYLKKNNWLTQWNGYTVLKDACGYLELEVVGWKNISGDHELFWFEVKKIKTNSEHNILMFQDLVKERVIL